MKRKSYREEFATTSIPEFPSWTIPLLLIVMVASVGLLVYHKTHKHNLVKKR